MPTTNLCLVSVTKTKSSGFLLPPAAWIISTEDWIYSGNSKALSPGPSPDLPQSTTARTTVNKREVQKFKVRINSSKYYPLLVWIKRVQNIYETLYMPQSMGQSLEEIV